MAVRTRRARLGISATPGRCKDFGRQIGAILTHPARRPRQDLSHVTVVQLGKGVGVVKNQQLSVRPLHPRAHDLYMTTRRKTCHDSSRRAGPALLLLVTGTVMRNDHNSALASCTQSHSCSDSRSVDRLVAFVDELPQDVTVSAQRVR